MALGLDAGVVGFVVPGFFVTVLYYPFFWVNLGFTGTLYLVVWRHRMAQRQEAARARTKTVRRADSTPRSLQPVSLAALPAGARVDVLTPPCPARSRSRGTEQASVPAA